MLTRSRSERRSDPLSPNAAAARAAPVSMSPEASEKLTALRDTEREEQAGRRPHAGDGSAGLDGKNRHGAAHAEDD
jgi:hypothetical protein